MGCPGGWQVAHTNPIRRRAAYCPQECVPLIIRASVRGNPLLQDVKIFDAGRAVLEDYLDSTVYPAHLTITESQPLADALAAQTITPETHLLTFENDGIFHAIPMTIVICYNVIQGTTNGKPWMMTFCNACNTGMVFDPALDGQTLHFHRWGSYDGLLLIWDAETGSYWQHITGQCLHGPSQGRQLRMITTTRQMNAAEAAARQDSILLTSTLSPEQIAYSGFANRMRNNPARVEAGILYTIAQEDTRRPRFELGLGVWSASRSIFYPLVTLHTRDNALITTFEGRPLLVYQSPAAIAPVAGYVAASRAMWEGDMLRLDGGAYIQNDLYFSSDGQSKPIERPTQLLMRWYGFALTFPGCDVLTL